MIEFVTIENAEELDRFAANHANHHFMQTTAWARVKKDWGWHGIICRDDNGEIKGTMALLRHDIKHFKTCYLYAPRGPICDCNDEAVFTELVEGAKKLAKDCGAYMIRIDPEVEETNREFLSLVKKLGFSVDSTNDFSLFQPRLCCVTDMTGLTEETLETKYHRTTKRYLNKGRKSNLTVRLGTLDDLPEFCKMGLEVAAKNEFKPRNEEYFRDFLVGLGDSARLYIAELDGKPVAGSILVVENNTGYFMYGFSYSEYQRECRPNELLQWYMQKDSLAEGCTRFDFRGVEAYPNEDGTSDNGLLQYKLGFGSDFYAYVGQLDLITKPLIKKALDAAMKIRKI